MLGRKPVSPRPPVQAKVWRRFARASVPPKGCRGEAGWRREQKLASLWRAFVSLRRLDSQQLLQFRFRPWTGEEKSAGGVFEVRALRVGNIPAIERPAFGI